MNVQDFNVSLQIVHLLIEMPIIDILNIVNICNYIKINNIFF